MDPLTALPAEIILRVLDYAPISSLASLTRLNEPWHAFIDDVHQDAIYSSSAKTDHPAGAKDFSHLERKETFDQTFRNVASWKDLCKRQTLLRRNWQHARPTVRERLMVPLSDQNRVWRFRADLKRRFFICTSQDGGLQVTDVDGKGTLWHLALDEVPPFAHLEYDDGMAVCSTLGDALEVWKTDEPDLPRGVFRKVAVLDCPIHRLRGFHLTYNTLCVVGDDGHGLVYDMTSEPPRLRLRMHISLGAVGHLCQAEDVVIYSMASEGLRSAGFHIHDKASGALRFIIDPKRCKRYYHIPHPTRPALAESGTEQRHVPSLAPYKLHSVEAGVAVNALEVRDGPYPFAATDQDLRTPVGEDEWGAGLLSGNLMVGISRAGRVLICSNWPQAIQDGDSFWDHAFIIECEDNTENFSLGGWLSVRDNRVLFEILDRVYAVSLNEEGKIPTAQQGRTRPSWCLFSAMNPVLQRRQQSGISMLALFEDCIMMTCGLPARSEHWALPGVFFHGATKGIRILSLAPKLD